MVASRKCWGMNNPIRNLFLVALAVCVLGFTWGTTIRWSIKSGVTEQTIYRIRTAEGGVVEFGLRSDGVVVWREIVNSTNSPAEVDWKNLTNFLVYPSVVMTNDCITNGVIEWKLGTTNSWFK